ncbi:hypothetical protein D3C86_2075240 [compost metagenome]
MPHVLLGQFIVRQILGGEASLRQDFRNACRFPSGVDRQPDQHRGILGVAYTVLEFRDAAGGAGQDVDGLAQAQ